MSDNISDTLKLYFAISINLQTNFLKMYTGMRIVKLI